MSVPHSIEFAGGDEECEKYLLEFAARAGAWAGRDTRRGRPSAPPSSAEGPEGRHWVVGGGAFLSTNPNTLSWKVRVARAEGKLTFHGETLAFPGTRAKSSRVTAYREGQLADFIETRLRGGTPDRFPADRLREPFSPFGSDPAAATASFAWCVAGGLGAVLLSLLAVTFAAFFLMSGTIRETDARSLLVESAGALPLPSRAEAASIGFGFRLGCAILFAAPVAFYFGFVHSLALVGGEVWPRLARLGQFTFLFNFILMAYALAAFLSVWTAVPLAALAAFATHFGYAAVWSRRRERVREGPRARPAVVAAGVILAAGLIGLLTPRPASEEERQNRQALFRDRYMLGNAPGKAAARFYYRHTLYAADPLKAFFSADRRKAQRLQRTATLTPGGSEEGPDPDPARQAFRALGFIVVPSRPLDADVLAGDWRKAPDVVATRNEVRNYTGGKAHSFPVRSYADVPALAAALEELSGRAFRGEGARSLNFFAWYAVYYAGPFFLLLVFVGICCPGASVIYRVFSRKVAHLTLLACLLTSGLILALEAARSRAVAGAVGSVEGDPSPDALASALASPFEIVRHEAAYRAFRNPSTALGDALLRAADDPDVRVRLWACAALGKTRHPGALPKLTERLGDPELFVRYRAAQGLGFLGRPEAVAPLVKMVREGTWYEGHYALEALRRIRPDEY